MRRRPEFGDGWRRWTRPLVTLLILVVLAAASLTSSAAAADGGSGSGGDGGNNESGIYLIRCNLPAAVVYNVNLSVNVPEGLIYQPESLTVSGASSSPAVTTSGPTDGTGAHSLLLDFGTVNNTLNSDLRVEFVAIVANLPKNQDGVVLLPMTATFSYDGGLGNDREFSGSIEPVSVVEPDLAIAKKATMEAAEGGDEIIVYTINIYHTQESHSGAFDVDVIESLPAGLSLVSGSAAITSGPAGSTTESGDGAATWHFDEIDQSWTESSPVVLTYQATIEGGNGSGSESEPAGDLTSGPETDLAWTSTAGENPQERSYSKTLVQSLSDLYLTIECDSESVFVDKTITYTYTVDNLGLVAVSGLNLTDDRLGVISLDATALEPGETAWGVVDYTVTSDDLPGPLRNNATASGTDALGGAVSASAEISIPFCTDPLAVKKTALNKTVSRGDNITYKIEIYTDTGPNAVSPTNIIVKDVFNRPVEFESASPEPDADGLWRFDKIDPGEKKVITLVVIVPEEQDFNFTSESGVTGSGFINVANDYSTSLDPYPLKNCVYVSFLNGTTKKTETISDCETVTVLGAAGTETSTREHGSGIYESADLLEMQTENDKISLEKDMAASHSTTTLGLYNNRTVTYTSKWTEAASAKNRATGTSMSESYRYATAIDRDSRMYLDENESLMETDTEFDGMGHISFLKMPTNESTFKATPVFESGEDYSGSFKIVEKTDEYGSAASSEKSASGEGLVSVDRRVGASQRSYEYGSGSYDSEELIETYTNYISKDISLVYLPSVQNITDDVSIESSQKWKEGIYSKVGSKSYIGEEYTSLTRLDKETEAKGLNEMGTEANFSGQARYRVVLKNTTRPSSSTASKILQITEMDLVNEWVKIKNPGSNTVDMTDWALSDDDDNSYTFPDGFTLSPGSTVTVYTRRGIDNYADGELYMDRSSPIWDDEGDCATLEDANGDLVDEMCSGGTQLHEIDIDEIYEGNYSIARKILISGTSKYDRAHLSVAKTLDEIVNKKTRISGETKTRRVATYTISIENDGNRAVAPIRVQDLFPVGAAYVGASLKPTETTATSANWTLTHLAIGDVAEIEVELDVTDCTGSEMTNRVIVCGGEGDDQICASNFSSQETDWLACYTDETVSVKKTAVVDGVNQTVVWYRIDIKNHDNATRVAAATDHLPEGMVLLDAMVPFASYDGSTITWNLIEIGPGEMATIAYRAEAQHAGRFVNSVEVDVRSVGGPVVQPVRATSVVEVGESSECESTSCDLWSPRDWDFEYVGSYAPNVACEEWASEEWLS